MPLAPEDLWDSSDERSQELASVACIYPELTILTPFSASIELQVAPLSPLPVAFEPDPADSPSYYPICYFPPLELTFTLPESYPSTSPPEIKFTSKNGWLWRGVEERLKSEMLSLWEGEQMVFTAIDHVREAAEKGFDLVQSDDGTTGRWRLNGDLKDEMLGLDKTTRKQVFDSGIYFCGICLERKRGADCHRIRSCTHVFCRGCLQDYYTCLIDEGTVSSVLCAEAQCGKSLKIDRETRLLTPPTSPTRDNQDQDQDSKLEKSTLLPCTLPPSELREIGLPENLITRYWHLKRKSALEADPDVAYCPREWCSAPSRASIKVLEAAMTATHRSFYLQDFGTPVVKPTDYDDEEVRTTIERLQNDRFEKLQVCSECNLAFCRQCKKGWHGTNVICRDFDPKLSEDDLATQAFITTNTTPCPTCDSPVLKSSGCNHMICKCQTHFCFLCSSYLVPSNPYSHYNTRGTECYQKLFFGSEELEEQEEHEHEQERVVGAGTDDENRVWYAPAVIHAPPPPPPAHIPPPPQQQQQQMARAPPPILARPPRPPRAPRVRTNALANRPR